MDSLRTDLGTQRASKDEGGDGNDPAPFLWYSQLFQRWVAQFRAIIKTEMMKCAWSNTSRYETADN
jgi:hypothetical protein